MITAFIIAMIVLMTLNLALNLLTIALGAGRGQVPIIAIVSMFLNLIFITWGIICLVTQ